MSTVRDLIKTRKREIFTINSSQTVYQALMLMAEKNVGALPVMEERRLVGILSERDYARKVILKGASSLDTMVKKIMTPRLISVDPQTSLEDCLDIMIQRHVRHLPILENEDMVDFISIGDLVKAILEYKNRLITELSSAETT
ncbi:CBS domain-containing protein [Geopsychrobacter electrodiphilus]|uniref:CBS domain-containing protein n=1 Tax=Geopsychrobacter electrodiphilus TaxID=225196 RepID=UPI00037393E2|nr:CBS domain-containing protein [Geopsychrobacter electrodiphilus]